MEVGVEGLVAREEVGRRAADDAASWTIALGGEGQGSGGSLRTDYDDVPLPFGVHCGMDWSSGLVMDGDM